MNAYLRFNNQGLLPLYYLTAGKASISVNEPTQATRQAKWLDSIPAAN